MVHARRATRRWGAYAALGIALAISGSALGEQANGRHGARRAGAPTQQAQPADAKPSPAAAVESVGERVARALEAHNAYEQSAKAQKDADETAKASTDAARWGMGLLIAGGTETVVTIVGVILVGLTLSAARRSAREAEKAAKEMKRSADSADRALRHARASSQKELRAYVNIATAQFETREGTTFAVVSFTNYGRTPAHDVWFEYKASIRPRPLGGGSGLPNWLETLHACSLRQGCRPLPLVSDFLTGTVPPAT